MFIDKLSTLLGLLNYAYPYYSIYSMMYDYRQNGLLKGLPT